MKTSLHPYYFHTSTPWVIALFKGAYKGIEIILWLPLFFLVLLLIIPYSFVSRFLSARVRDWIHYPEQFFPTLLVLTQDEFALIKPPARPSAQTKNLRCEGSGLYWIKPFHRCVWKGTPEEWDHFDPMAL